MKKIFHAITLMLIVATLFQCRKEPGYVGTPDPDPVPVAITPNPITANLQGNILDENDQPAEGVSITVGSSSTVTNNTGYFKIDNAGLDKKNTMVLAQKTGYFKGIRLFAATSGTNYITIKLIKKIQAGTVDAINGGTVTLTNGSSVALPANGIKIASSGNAYTGTVNVFAQYIDPSSADIGKIVPGSFAAIDKDGKTVVLTSYGMMAVELESAAGEKLQIKEGAVATLTSPIPAAAMASAPATIPLWYVDEQTGLWREEGTATKQGNNYVGDVKHFSFWNCDLSNEAVMLTMRILNANNSPLVNTAVKLTRVSGWVTSVTGYTDSLGQVSGLVPYNVMLSMEILDPCGAISYSQNIPALTQNTDLGNIIVSSSTSGLVTVKGKLLDCNDQPVTNGFAMITFGNSFRYATTDANGNYETSFVTCPNSGSTASIEAYDMGTGGNGQHSASVIVNLTTPVSNLADIVVCDATTSIYINYNIDGVDYYWNQPNAFQMFGVNFPGSISIQADNQPDTRLFTLSIEGTSVGTFPATFTSTDAFPNGGTVFYLPGFIGTITNYATSWPDFFEGSFSGQYTHSSTGSTVHTINGTFRIQHQ